VDCLPIYLHILLIAVLWIVYPGVDELPEEEYSRLEYRKYSTRLHWGNWQYSTDASTCL